MGDRSLKITAVLFILLLSSQPSLLSQAQGPTLFQKVKWLMPSGKKSKEISVTLWFAEDKLVIRSDLGGRDVKSFPYTAIRRGDYSYSKHPRWKSGIGAAIVVGIFAVPVFFMKSKKHWLTVQTENDYAVLRLHKKNFLNVRAVFETMTGLKVETVGEKK